MQQVCVISAARMSVTSAAWHLIRQSLRSHPACAGAVDPTISAEVCLPQHAPGHSKGWQSLHVTCGHCVTSICHASALQLVNRCTFQNGTMCSAPDILQGPSRICLALQQSRQWWTLLERLSPTGTSVDDIRMQVVVPCPLTGTLRACRDGSNAEDTQVLSWSRLQGHPDAVLKLLKMDPASAVCTVQTH